MARPVQGRAREDRAAVAELARELAALSTMTVAELAERYEVLMGEPTRTRNRDWLRKKLGWRIQELREGGLSERAKARIAELGPGTPIRTRAERTSAVPEPPAPTRDPRLPEPGAVLVRVHQGTEHRVTVQAEGFEYLGEPYPSLSKIARVITGTPWNGFAFFGLARRKRAEESTS